ncbi:MAG: methyltransferase domain-containing protein [Dehalococcoidia bacterium]|nr:methyltransferase domain-containing protein [Dehalococcoidia bacterium]
MTEAEVPDQVLEDMITYYRERAAEYDEWFYRRGRYDYGAEANQRWFDEADEIVESLSALELQGEVLELAPGTGIWTERLATVAERVTAIDSSLEMMAINRARLGPLAERVTYLQGDLFGWQPRRQYDAVFFGFWLSHVPRERLGQFLTMVASALRPGGKLFFVDGRPESTVTAIDQRHPDGGSQIMTRKLNDGRTFEVVKNFYPPADLEQRFRAVGLKVGVKETPTYFIYGLSERP